MPYPLPLNFGRIETVIGFDINQKRINNFSPRAMTEH